MADVKIEFTVKDITAHVGIVLLQKMLENI